MQRMPVASSNLKSVGYDPVTQTLEVEFHSGGVYQYYGVPVEEFEALMAAKSHGQYLSRYIRNVYHYRQVAS